ncbi:MAG: sucrase ferredoxin [Marmoricola sp.]|nr:sucrase ferredoxin [Marmoricola sp.]
MDDLAGTATHVTAFLLVEHHGPWGASAPGDSRLPDSVKDHLRTHRNIKVLMARRHHRAHRGEASHVFLCFPARRLLLMDTFEDPEELTRIDLDAVSRGVAPDWTPLDGPLFGVCTHGRHDACCAERGRPVAAALSGSHPAETWEISHMGGDRFAANMIALPEGLYYGRMDPGSASQVASLHQQGRVDIERLRGRSSYPMQVQYAEIALRRHFEEDRLDALRLVRRHGPMSVFTREGVEWAVTVRRTTRGEAQMTCSLERLSPIPFFEVVSIDQVTPDTPR